MLMVQAVSPVEDKIVFGRVLHVSNEGAKVELLEDEQRIGYVRAY